jgi:hypothetical protein
MANKKVLYKRHGGKFPSRAHPLRGIGAGREMEKWTTLSPAQKKMLKKSTTITPAEQRKIDKGIKERRMSLDKDVKAKSKPKKPPVGLEWKKKSKFKSTYGGPVRRTKEAKKGGTVSKRNGGMTRVGLSPAEEARAGVMSEAARRRPRMPTPTPPVRPVPRIQAPVRPVPRTQVPVRPDLRPQPPVRPALRPPVPQMVPRRPMNKGGTISRKMSGQEVVDMGYKGFV